MKTEIFGKLSDGREVKLYTLRCGESSATITDYGATITSFRPFGIRDIIGGYDELSSYEQDNSNQGATIGRVANRIAGAEFTMDGAIYMLPANNNGNCLHGGVGFKRKIWDVLEYDGASILLSCFSPDGDDGFPSDLLTKVRYTLREDALIISYEAIPGGKTPIALTNHSYFNLNGFGGDVKDHIITIFADRYTEVDETLIPTGVRPSVEGTPFDLRSPKRIGADFCDDFSGYDHNFFLSPTEYEEFLGVKLGLGATVESGGLRMSFYTDQPGVQLYTANFLGGEPDFRGGVKRIRHGAFCLEAQTEPNATKRGECFYEAGEIYTQTTVYKIEKI